MLRLEHSVRKCNDHGDMAANLCIFLRGLDGEVLGNRGNDWKCIRAACLHRVVHVEQHLFCLNFLNVCIIGCFLL